MSYVPKCASDCEGCEECASYKHITDRPLDTTLQEQVRQAILDGLTAATFDTRKIIREHGEKN